LIEIAVFLYVLNFVSIRKLSENEKASEDWPECFDSGKREE
jgi:hypothetical protein